MPTDVEASQNHLSSLPTEVPWDFPPLTQFPHPPSNFADLILYFVLLFHPNGIRELLNLFVLETVILHETYTATSYTFPILNGECTIYGHLGLLKPFIATSNCQKNYPQIPLDVL